MAALDVSCSQWYGSQYPAAAPCRWRWAPACQWSRSPVRDHSVVVDADNVLFRTRSRTRPSLRRQRASSVDAASAERVARGGRERLYEQHLSWGGSAKPSSLR